MDSHLTPLSHGPDTDSSPSILIVDDDKDVVRALEMILGRVPYRVTAVYDGATLLAKLASERYDIILLDLNLTRGRSDGAEGMALLDQILLADPAAIVVVITAHSGLAGAVAAMRAGAIDFITKPWNNARLLTSVAQAAILGGTRRQIRNAGNSPAPSAALSPMIGESAVFSLFCVQLHDAASSRLPLLISGPAGNGKSLAARTLGNLIVSPQSGLIIPAILAAEQGWEREQIAQPSLLIIEDIDRLNALDQARLLRRLEHTAGDIRLIGTATDHTNLSGDLLDRMAVAELAVPPLAARGGDGLLLARHFIRCALPQGAVMPTLASECEQLLCSLDWPDGVRGLKRAVTRAALGGKPHITAEDLGLNRPVEISPPSPPTLEAAERAIIEAALSRHGFNVSHAATALGISRGALYRRMAKYGI